MNSLDNAAAVFGDFVRGALHDVNRLDRRARAVVSAFDALDHDARVELGEQYPRLVEGLILLENYVQRVDGR